MYITDLPPSLDRRSVITTSTPLDKSPFTLDSSAVLGFFGGDEAVSAMAAVHIYQGRRWLGWYNTPGSYQIARQYGLVAKSWPLLRGLFPDDRADTAKLFAFDGSQGPSFYSVKSGAVVDSTGHLAFILMKDFASRVAGTLIEGRDGPGASVTIVKLRHVPPAEVTPKRIFTCSPFFAIIPIIVNLSTCIACAAYRDWFSFSSILLGILSNGISCLVIGSGTLRFKHHNHDLAAGSSPGDGILSDFGNDFALLQGEEGAIHSIIHGKFSVDFPRKHYEEYIGYCSIIFLVQFIAQLLLVPQGSLFGQIMFIFSLTVSWVYNVYLSAVDRERIQRHILLDTVLQKPSLAKYTLTTRTAAIVFALLVLSPEDPRAFLDALLPDNTKVWRQWKEAVLQRLPTQALHIEDVEWNLEGYTEQEKNFLLSLSKDAKDAYNGWLARR